IMNRTQSKRCFNRINKKSGALSGEYYGFCPKQAASKCYIKIVKKYSDRGKKIPKSIKIYLYESTPHSEHKIYGYRCKKIIFDKPVNVIINRDTCGEKNIEYKSKLE